MSQTSLQPAILLYWFLATCQAEHENVRNRIKNKILSVLKKRSIQVRNGPVMFQWDVEKVVSSEADFAKMEEDLMPRPTEGKKCERMHNYPMILPFFTMIYKCT